MKVGTCTQVKESLTVSHPSAGAQLPPGKTHLSFLLDPGSSWAGCPSSTQHSDSLLRVSLGMGAGWWAKVGLKELRTPETAKSGLRWPPAA